jgi:hypothetical protein
MTMSLLEFEALLLQRRAAILRRCLHDVFETYPAETARFMSDERDRFRNPVGYSITHGLETLFEELAGTMDPGRVAASLDEIIRIRAVQDFSPQAAVSFVFILRDAVLGELGVRGPAESLPEREGLRPGLVHFEQRIGKVAVQAMNIYVRCREQVATLEEEQRKSPRRRTKKLG